jgi:hypothetical protein
MSYELESNPLRQSIAQATILSTKRVCQVL